MLFDAKEKRNCLVLAAITVSSILLVWAPFVLGGNTGVLFRYWDGPSYVTVAYSLYSTDNPIYPIYGFGPEFYAAHFPAYPLLIRLFSFIGYFNAMFFLTAAFAVLSVIAFYFLAREFFNQRDALALSVVFVFFPARWLLYHSVGASEPLFLFSVISSAYFFTKRRMDGAAAFGVLATLTRINGVLLFPAFVGILFWKDRKKLTKKNFLLLCLIPLALFLLFSFYWLQFGSFLAATDYNQSYFKGLFSAITDLGTAQLGEFYAILFGAYALGTARLWQRKRFEFFAIALVFFVPVLFMSHYDLARYLLPAAPFALLFAFDDWIVGMARKKAFWIVLALFVAASLAYIWHVLPQNLMPEEPFSRLAAFVSR